MDHWRLQAFLSGRSGPRQGFGLTFNNLRRTEAPVMLGWMITGNMRETANGSLARSGECSEAVATSEWIRRAAPCAVPG